MKKPEFLTPTLEEYQALVRLKKKGVENLSVYFYGSGDDGDYGSIDFCGDHTVTRDKVAGDLKIVEKYLYRNLDARHDISFNDEGCRGSIEIDLTGEQFEMTLSTEVPVWEADLFVHDQVAPSSEIEILASEVTA
jgi:hypothetical protein